MFLIKKLIGSLVDEPPPNDDETEAEFEDRLERLVEETKNNDEEETLNLDSLLVYYEDYGKITHLNDAYGTINDVNEFSLSIAPELNLKIDDIVHFLALKNKNSKTFVVKKILSKETEKKLLTSKQPVLHECFNKILVGHVVENEGSLIKLSPQNTQLNLKHTVPKIYPISGDWLSLNVIVKTPEFNFEEEQIILVESVDYLRKMTAIGIIHQYNNNNGIGIIKVKTDDIFIYFKIADSPKLSFIPTKNKMVKCDAVESEQAGHKWRAIALCDYIDHDEKERIEIKNGIRIMQNVSFGKMSLNECKNLCVDVINISDVSCTLVNCFLSKRSENQITLLNPPQTRRNLNPNETVSLVFQCTAKYAGRSKETFIIEFEGFEICQHLLLNITNFEEITSNHTTNRYKQKMVNPFIDYSNKTIIKAPRLLPVSHFSDIRLTLFTIPKKFKSLYLENNVQSKEKLLKEYPCLLNELDYYNYCEKFHHLIYMTELSEMLAVKKLNQESICMTKQDEFLCLEIEGLSNLRPILRPMDTLKVNNHLDLSIVYDGSICKIIGDKLFLKFEPSFHTLYKGEDVSIDFIISQTTYTYLHNAVRKAHKKLGPMVLFPSEHTTNEGNFEFHSNFTWFNPRLNDVQKTAISNFFQNKYKLPFVVFGPPGTGKTVTLVEAILQVFKRCSDSRIIVTTPSNSAADNIMESLIEYSFINPGVLIRYVSYTVAVADTMKEHLKPYCTMINGESMAHNQKYQIKLSGILYSSSKSTIGRHKIIISTLGNMGKLMKINFPKGHFTHLFVDEAGQATEPEIMIPFGLLDNNYGRVCIAGDPKQLGPVILSEMAKEFGLDKSFLERILSTKAYENNSSLVVQLVHNYRSLPKILDIPNNEFYKNSLIANLNLADEEIKADLNILMSMMSNDVVYDLQNFPCIFFHGIRGTNYRQHESPSWFNPDEATMVLLFTSKLYKNGFSHDDIGIITPYVEQVRYIRKCFEGEQIFPPKIGTVEEFQGQERKIIIISVVRSMKSMDSIDVNYQLGFVSNPKRVNVALTRTKFLTMIFGNPHNLCLDPLWRNILKYVINNNSYWGCDLPFNLE